MPRQIYALTGKGGVGKSSLALGLAHRLALEGKKVLYNALDRPAPEDVCRQLGIDFFNLNVRESTQRYLARKLKTQTVASWLLKIPFVEALFDITPSLASLVLMGDIVHRAEEGKGEFHLVLDLPATGHALSLFEASHHFRSILESGSLADDIDSIHILLRRSGFMKVIIPSLPTALSAQESLELRESLKKIHLIDIDLLINNSYRASSHLQGPGNRSLPDFLKKKIALEEEALRNWEGEFTHTVPHLFENNSLDIIKSIATRAAPLL